MRCMGALVLIGSLVGCATETPDHTPEELVVISKCVFQVGARSETIEPGQVFLYVLRDDGWDATLSERLYVSTGVATVGGDALTDDVRRQPLGDVLRARTEGDLNVDFGKHLAADRSGERDHWVGLYRDDNSILVAIGTTYGTSSAYPTCATRPFE